MAQNGYIDCRMKQDNSVALFFPVTLLKNHRAITSNGLALPLERERETDRDTAPMVKRARAGWNRDYGVAESPKKDLCDRALHGAVRMGTIQSVQVD